MALLARKEETVIAASNFITQADWGFVLARFGWLLALAILCAWLATRAFRSYQRSV